MEPRPLRVSDERVDLVAKLEVVALGHGAFGLADRRRAILDRQKRANSQK